MYHNSSIKITNVMGGSATLLILMAIIRNLTRFPVKCDLHMQQKIVKITNALGSSEASSTSSIGAGSWSTVTGSC